METREYITRYVVATFDKDLIDSLSRAMPNEKGTFFCMYAGKLVGCLVSLPPTTEKLYYQNLSLVSPRWRNAREVAERLAGAKDPRIVEDLELTRASIFTPDVERAMDFNYEQAQSEVAAFTRLYGARFTLENVLREDTPF